MKYVIDYMRFVKPMPKTAGLEILPTNDYSPAEECESLDRLYTSESL
jgi:hypothetical protein